MKFDIFSKQTNCRGETVCGDAVLVLENTEENKTLVAVVDGLGHGPSANQAAIAFLGFVEAAADDIPLHDLFHAASAEIARTRGVAASIARFDGATNTLAYAGVGNVELSAISAAPIRPISKPGIVGRRLGRIIEFEYQLHLGDLIVIFTDGVSSRFNLEKYRRLEPRELCDQLIEEHGKNHDDATVTAIRCI